MVLDYFKTLFQRGVVQGVPFLLELRIIKIDAAVMDKYKAASQKSGSHSNIIKI